MTLRTIDDDLEDPGLARLLSLARERFEALGGVRGRICVPELDPAEAFAIDTLWRRAARKRPRRGQDFTCSLSDLDASLRATLGVGLEVALIRTGGPLHLRPQRRAEDGARTAAFWDLALAHPLCGDDPAVRAWAERLRGTGALGATPWSTDRGESLLSSLAVAATLPRDPPIERSTLANELLGDPHALDDGTVVGDRLVALLAARDERAGDRMTAGQRRALLQRFGVLCDPASATVLTLGLYPIGASPLERALRLLLGGHVVLTLGQLARLRLRFAPGLRIRLCENPTVVLRAEDRLGAAAGPLVCTGGWPGSAVCALLDVLRDAGATFEQHGDFDWEGLAIHDWLRERYDVRAWRFDAIAYRHAAASIASPGALLKDPRHRHATDDPLAAELDRQRIAVPEEAVLDQLVADLRTIQAGTVGL
ncbi:MAG TPA: TIGR02679 family protein [Solirubrobacteraceae bacterium]|nr:TIGR02679 family protein [Solirubrobacteraceae bacterium]